MEVLYRDGPGAFSSVVAERGDICSRMAVVGNIAGAK